MPPDPISTHPIPAVPIQVAPIPVDAIPVIEPGVLPPPDGAVAQLGGKAFNLMVLAAAGLPVPPGFVLPTTLCAQWLAAGAPPADAFRALVAGPLHRLEQATGLAFGDPNRPLLVSIRSGAPVSMPGMLDTLLNVGLTRATLPGLIALSGNPRLAWDCFARLIRAFGQIVRGLDPALFDDGLAAILRAGQAASAAELDSLSLRDLALRYLDIFESAGGVPFPDTPMDQLAQGVDAVFRSWNSERAQTYRRLRNLTGLPGTAVTIQRMVYGNSGPQSGSGVGFTRDPATGERRLYLDFAFNAQGEDLVAGRTLVTPATELARAMPQTGPTTAQAQAITQTLARIATQLEHQFHDMQDFEFTVEEGQLYLLQTRAGKCAARARLRIAVDMARENLISIPEALRRVEGLDAAALTRRRLAGPPQDAIARGVPAGGGAVTGAVVLSRDAARTLAGQGRRTILVTTDLLTEDIDAITGTDGLLAAHGGRTSHAAVVAREFGKVAIVGCPGLTIAPDRQSCRIAGHPFPQGADITLDGETGQVFAGHVPMTEDRPEADLAQIAAWRAAPPA